jgi:hypothetical protein
MKSWKILILIILLILIQRTKVEFLRESDCEIATVEDCIRNSNDIDNSIEYAKFSSVCRDKCKTLLEEEKKDLYGETPQNRHRLCETRIITNKNLCLRNPRSSKINASNEKKSLMYRDKYCKKTCSDWFDKQIDMLSLSEGKYDANKIKIVHFKPKIPSGMHKYYENLMVSDDIHEFLRIAQNYLYKLTGNVFNIESTNGKYEIITLHSEKSPGFFYGEFSDTQGALPDSLKLRIHDTFINELGGNYKTPEIKQNNYDPNAIYVFFIEGINNHMYTNTTCGYAELIGPNSVENVNDKFTNIYKHSLDRTPKGALFVHMFLKGLDGKCSFEHNYKKDEISYLHHVFLHEVFHAMGISRPLFKCTDIDSEGNFVYNKECKISSRSPEHNEDSRYHLMYSDATGKGSWLASFKPDAIVLDPKYKKLLEITTEEYAKLSKENPVVSNDGKFEEIPEYKTYNCTSEPNKASIHPRCYFRSAQETEK